MIITSDCQKYHATRVKIFHRLVLVPSGIPFLPDPDQDRRTENGGRRMKDRAIERRSTGGLEYWSVGVLECWSVAFGVNQIGYAYWLRAN